MSSIKLKTGSRPNSAEKTKAIQSVIDDGVAPMRIDIPKSIHKILKKLAGEIALIEEGKFGMKHLVIEGVEDVLEKYARGEGKYQKRLSHIGKEETKEVAAKIRTL